MDHHKNSFPQWLKQRRKALDLTQKSLALCVGCSHKTIEKIELGERRPSRQIAEIILECLQASEDERPALLRLARSESTDERMLATAPASGRPNNLPAPLTSFIGRESVLAEVCNLLRKPGVRLVTLSGPPGIGKTRLSLQVGAALLSDYSDGVFFVPLAAIRDPALLPSQIARVLGLRESGSISITGVVEAYLQAKELLLILDNFEQIIEAAPLVTELLAQAPRLKVLVSSREVLHVYGEHNYLVPPLRVPGVPLESSSTGQPTEYEAVSLFVERGAAARNDFSFTEENDGAIVEICGALDGLPLAIELAAARTSQFSPEEMLPMLQRRLDLLVEGPRDLTPRQRTLRGAIEWSYDLLDGDEQMLFRTLSVFAGNFTQEEVAAVCLQGERGDKASVATVLKSLQDKSLVVKETRYAGMPLYRVLETIREYAWERAQESGECDELQQRHARVYLQLAESATPFLAGPEQMAWLDKLTEAHDNLRAAMEWLITNDAEDALSMANALTIFWYRRGHLSEGRSYLVAALAEGSLVKPAVRGKALNGAGSLAYAQADLDEAKSLYALSLAAHREAGDKTAIARALNNLGLVAGSQGDYAAAYSYYDDCMAIWKELGDKAGIALSLNNLMTVDLARGDYRGAEKSAQESVALRRELGDDSGVASSLGNLALVIFALGDEERATALQEDSLAIRRALGDKRGTANCLVNLGELARYRGDYSAAQRLCTECLDICREIGDKAGIANAQVNLGYVAFVAGRLEDAYGCFSESKELFGEVGDRRGQVQSLVGLAAVAGERGDAKGAVRLLGAADATLREIGSHMYPHERGDYERTIEAVKPRLSESEWQQAWEYGRALIT